MKTATTTSLSNNLAIVSDGYTKILPDRTSSIKLDKPVMIAGFPDIGMVGSISTAHLIGQLGMHQIAYIESQYVMPAAIFIAKKFRHPFRIYANEAGTVCALICEVPVIVRGTHSIISTIIDWSENAGVKEVVVLGGILPTNFSPPYLLERKPLILQNEITFDIKYADPDSTGQMAVPDDALIVGLAGSLLSASSARGLKCKAIMIPTMSEAPDPEGAAIVLESLQKIPLKLDIDTTSLRRRAEAIRRHLEELLKMHKQQMHEYERTAGRDTERIYK